MFGPKSTKRIAQATRRVENNLGEKKSPNRTPYLPAGEIMVVEMLEDIANGQVKEAKRIYYTGTAWADDPDVTSVNVLGWGLTDTVTSGSRILCFRYSGGWLAAQPYECP